MGELNLDQKEEVAESLISYGQEMEEWVKPTDKTRKFGALAANSFLLGVLLDRNIPAERAWDAGQWIAESVGDEEEVSVLWENLEKMEEHKLVGFLRYGYGGDAFHMYYNKFSEILPDVASVINEKYYGDPRKIWNGQRDVQKVKDRLEELPGIGPALSSMAVLILSRNYGLLGGKEALQQLDIKPDVHLMRVFYRAGLVSNDNDKVSAVSIARELSEEFPSALDAPAWEIGRGWCHPQKPDCEGCPITRACAKNV